MFSSLKAYMKLWSIKLLFWHNVNQFSSSYYLTPKYKFNSITYQVPTDDNATYVHHSRTHNDWCHKNNLDYKPHKGVKPLQGYIHLLYWTDCNVYKDAQQLWIATSISASSPCTPSNVLFCPAEDKSSESSPTAEDRTAKNCGIGREYRRRCRWLETS
jgi:hypothetical protein